MGDAPAQAAITAALLPDGAIMAAIVAEIKKTFEQGNRGDLLIQAAAGAAANTLAVPAVITAIKDEGSELSKLLQSEYDRRADKAFPYRAKLRQLSVAEWNAAWRDMVVDSDQVSWTMQAVEQNPTLANIMALSAANPANHELAELKRATTARYAAKVSWKSLCLDSEGGSWDRLKNFLLEKSDSPLENVKCLARSLLVLINLIERRCTVVQSAKKTGPEKAAAQKTALMDLIYHTIKQYKRRTTKASASVPLEHEVLLRDFAQDLILGEAVQASGGGSKRSLPGPSGGQATAGDSQPNKAPRLAASAPPAASPGGAGAGGTNPASKRKDLVESLLQELTSLVQKATPPKKLQSWMDKQYLIEGQRNAMITLFATHVCKNCLMAGKGIKKHTLKQCRELKNLCVLPCTKCTNAGRTENVLHWVADCKY